MICGGTDLYNYAATLLAVHDGDTLRLNIDLGFRLHNEDMDMRLFGVDAPELKRPDKLGEKARDAIKAWFVDHSGPYVLTTVLDRTEKYGRYLAKSITAKDKHELIADQIAAGFLKPYTGKGPKPLWGVKR
jgi:micrococcal nuclease